MALKIDQNFVFGSVRGPQALAVYLIGLGAIFIGERVIGGEDALRFVVGGLGLLTVLVSLVSWLIAWIASDGEKRVIEKFATLFSLGGLVALGLYLLGSELVLGPAPVTRSADEGVGIRQILAVAWPVVLTCSVLPLIFVQWSATTMSGGEGVEIARVRASARAGTTIAMLLCTLFLVNAIADRKDIHNDLSYFKTTSPSESTVSLIAGLDTDTQVLLFFPAANEVLLEIRPYFDWLEGESDHLEVKLVDRALEPELAKQHRVSKDGTVVVVRGESRQTVDLGDNLDRAKRKLKKFDEDFQKAIMKLTRERKTVYLLIGHGERRPERVEGDSRSRMNTLKQFLIANNFTVKDLGAMEGLTSLVPDDAALLLWLDPGLALFPGEGDTIKAYLENGGRMLITLDPDSEAIPEDILQFLGLDYSKVPLGHSRGYVPLSRTKADHYNLITNNFSSHQAVSVLSRYRKHMPVLIPRSGSLDKVTGTKRKINFIVRTLADTWEDLNGNMARDKEEESKTHQLAAAVSMKITPDKAKKDTPKDAAKGAEKKKPAESPPQEEMRVVVLADSDVFADDYIGFRIGASGHPGNFQLLSDILKWLVGEGEVTGIPTSEEDIKIAHTREGETLWFYATIFFVPLLIMGVGVGTRWGRGRKRRAGR